MHDNRSLAEELAYFVCVHSTCQSPRARRQEEGLPGLRTIYLETISPSRPRSARDPTTISPKTEIQQDKKERTARCQISKNARVLSGVRATVGQASPSREAHPEAIPARQ